MNKFYYLDNESMIRSLWLFWGHVLVLWDDPDMSLNLNLSVSFYRKAYGD